MRAGPVLFPLARASDGRDTAEREGFFGGGAGFVSFGSVAPVAVLDAVAAVLVREAFKGDPALKFHTLRTIDLAEDRIPNRGVALPLSERVRPVSNSIAIGERGKGRTHCSQPEVQGPSQHACYSFSFPFSLRASFA